jgi:hypothetical protein
MGNKDTLQKTLADAETAVSDAEATLAVKVTALVVDSTVTTQSDAAKGIVTAEENRIQKTTDRDAAADAVAAHKEDSSNLVLGIVLTALFVAGIIYLVYWWRFLKPPTRGHAGGMGLSMNKI